MRRALLCLGLVLAFVADAQVGRVQITCVGGMCAVPQPVLEKLTEQAQLASVYGGMCNWPGYR